MHEHDLQKPIGTIHERCEQLGRRSGCHTHVPRSLLPHEKGVKGTSKIGTKKGRFCRKHFMDDPHIGFSRREHVMCLLYCE
jgi:hypothetical protein